MKCPECGLGYVPDFPEDARFQKKYHDTIVNGVPARRIKGQRVVWEDGQFRITVVNYFSSMSQKKRAERAALVAHNDTNFDLAPYHATERFDERNVHVFLLHCQNRIIGLLVLERRSHIWKCTWPEYEKGSAQRLDGHPIMWSIAFVWIHRCHRRKELARLLVIESTSFFELAPESVGWYTPFTQSGDMFVRHLCPDCFYIAK